MSSLNLQLIRMGIPPRNCRHQDLTFNNGNKFCIKCFRSVCLENGKRIFRYSNGVIYKVQSSAPLNRGVVGGEQ